MKKVVYSCLFWNGKRKLDEPFIQPEDKLEGYDYMMFTNVPDKLTNTGWMPINKPLINDHPIYTAKYYKWNAHQYLTDYNIGIYVDAYLSPNNNIQWNDYISQLKINGLYDGIILMKHPFRQCIYVECDAIHQCRKDTKVNMDKVINFLQSENMPKDYGLCQAGLFIRNFKNNDVNQMCEELFMLMLKNTYRDQALISYVFWKHNEKINTAFAESFFCKTGKIGDHNYT